jgi:hypothetical protein
MAATAAVKHTPATSVTLPDGRTYMVHPGHKGWRIVRTNCGPGLGACRMVPAFTPLHERVLLAAFAKTEAAQ